MKISPKHLASILFLVVVGVLTRTVLHVAPNFEFVTAATLVAAALLPKRYSWTVPAAIILISDFIIGNSNIFLFTWSGFAFTYILGLISRSYISKRLTGQLMGTEALAVVSVLLFYFWTNLGVVLLSPLYPLSWTGYLQSLIMALPFLKMQLLSVAITTPVLLLSVKSIQAAFLHKRFRGLGFEPR